MSMQKRTEGTFKLLTNWSVSNLSFTILSCLSNLPLVGPLERVINYQMGQELYCHSIEAA